MLDPVAAALFGSAQLLLVDVVVAIVGVVVVSVGYVVSTREGRTEDGVEAKHSINSGRPNR